MAQLQHVDLRSYPLDRFLSLVDLASYESAHEVLTESRDLLEGRVVWHVNSTPEGGGVAEMLRSLLAYARGAGIDARWLVIEGNPDFFRLTKRLHHALHGSRGDGSPLGAEARRVYEEVSAANAEEMLTLVRPGDVVFLHDPQTAGLAAALMRARAIVVWRCHIGMDDIDEEAELGWAFLGPYLKDVPVLVFSREEYIPPSLNHGHSVVIHPSIDAFSTKNEDLTLETSRAILAEAGLIAHEDAGAHPTFTREDGSPARVERTADVLRTGEPPHWEDPLVVQVSRWDPLKDHEGVMRGFAAFAQSCDPNGRTQLVLAGPNVEGVVDDPEGGIILAELKRFWATLPEPIRSRVHLASLPMDDVEENAAMVNALQRHARVIVQKSLREGFGLTVTEAMWKSRAIVASGVGGIRNQIVDGVHGVLLEDPRDLDEFQHALCGVLSDLDRADELGANARERVREQFLGIRHLAEYHGLINRLCE